MKQKNTKSSGIKLVKTMDEISFGSGEYLEILPLVDESPVKYLSNRGGGNLWAESANFVHTILKCLEDENEIFNIMPVTLEFAPTLECNQHCNECPYRVAKRKAGLSRVPAGQFIESEDGVTTADTATARWILESAVLAGVKGALWTGGGEPTLWKPLPEMIRYAAELGMANGLYTNGIQTGFYPALAELFAAPENKMDFVRVSLNALSPHTVKKFSGISPKMAEKSLLGLKALLQARTRYLPEYYLLNVRPPSIQVSVITDERNVDDLPLICSRTAELMNDYSATYHGKEDNFVVRPLTRHCRKNYSTKDHEDSVIKKILTHCGTNGQCRKIIENAGMKTALGFGLDLIEQWVYSTYEDIIRAEYKRRDLCWSNGLFLTAGPDAGVYSCCDRNCYPAWSVGNLKNQSVEEIYRSEKRKKLLDRIHKHSCNHTVCEATCRTGRLNGIARALMSGELTDKHIEFIRNISLKNPGCLLLS